ncbi:pentapeptide repeat-containing protein [Kordiimonas sp. SCSIO 12603]|uniref:pentapeptide repeat-containing protein n=1 Tax=Kordiimonas sp. SCSIO 12603 TaxID=2829596 RepID=UPI0021039451|nr:pentapeptide repeat-containing protein [Kordiimonas sp. SCSIO 12603]UTW60005.1 pentapeptide repeat-containing protein [Kordiimonas sp. SCSIO 12603]
MPKDQPENGEKEKYYTPDGTEIRFEDRVPDLLRDIFTGETVLTITERIRAKAADNLTPVERAKCGAAAWNMWVQVYADRWCVREEKGTHAYVRLKSVNDEAYEEHFIDFSDGQEKDENGKYKITFIDFTHFHFPTQATFAGATFSGGVTFEWATFSDRADFEWTTFSGGADFRGTTFSDRADFERATFSVGAYFMRATFSDNADFTGATFSSTVDFESATFSSTVDFESATFSGEVDFIKATFTGDVYFERATFSGEAYLERAIFSCGADFERAEFYDKLSSQGVIFLAKTRWNNTVFYTSVNFSESQFLAGCDFENAKFKAFANFDYVCFGKPKTAKPPERYEKWDKTLQDKYDKLHVTSKSETVPNFRGAVFEQAPNLGYTEIADIPIYKNKEENQLNLWQRLRTKGEYLLTSRTYDSQAAAKLRRIQELANQGHHHLAEKKFFRVELLARRGNEAKGFWERAMIRSFDIISKCGLSFARPLMWLFFFWLPAFMFIYANAADISILDLNEEEIWNVAQYSFANSLSFLGGLLSEQASMVQYLFPIKANIPHWWKLLHNSIATLHIFFAFLAVRNYFKLG